jgi:endonuclease VIII
MRTDAGLTVHSHLRMSGRWSVLRPGRRLPARERDRLRVALRLDDGRTAVGIALPVLTVLRTADEHRVVGHLGPDLLGPDTDTDDGLARAARRLRSGDGLPAVAALLDQRRVAGLGNMWAQEVLFLDRVSPWAPIRDAPVERLLRTARARLRDSVAAYNGQSTTGRPRPRHWVYGRAGRPCLRCGTPVAFRPAERAGPGRETWWCPGCQA